MRVLADSLSTQYNFATETCGKDHLEENIFIPLFHKLWNKGGEEMAKWISPIFSDARNKLGDAVVFSNWKGRSYFRS